MRLRRTFIAVCILLSSLATAALAKPVVKLQLTGMLVTVAHGRASLKPIARVTLHQGEKVRWVIQATNTGSSAALGLAPVGHVPAHMRYLAASANASQPGTIEYSLDGKNWSARPMIAVHTAHGIVHKPAPPSSYVSIRFLTKKPLAPRATFRYSYEVIVK